MDNFFDTVIIGGGPAGLSAAIYAAAGGLSTLVIDKSPIFGGKINNIVALNNYPGLKTGIDGFTFSTELYSQAKGFGAQFVSESCSKISVIENNFKEIITDKSKYISESVIIACGTTSKRLNIENEEKLTGYGVSYCATCDGALYKNKAVAIIGGGNTALSDALYLARIAKKVVLIHRRNKFRASVQLQNDVFRLVDEGKIQLLTDTVPQKILGEEYVTGLVCENIASKEIKQEAFDGIFVAVGIKADEAFGNVLKQLNIVLTNDGFVITNEKMQTNIEGIFAAGDIRNTPLRQVVTAAADGAIAGTFAIEYANRKQ